MADANNNFTGFENKSYEENIVFIKNTLSKQGIPANFVPLQHTNAEKFVKMESGSSGFCLKTANSSARTAYVFHRIEEVNLLRATSTP